MYRTERLPFVPPRFAFVDTLFSLPETCLYADLVDLLSQRKGFHLDPWKLFDDTRNAIDEAHRDDTLKSLIVADLPNFIERDLGLAPTLHKLRSSGKKIFLLTNSFWPYTSRVMSYLLNESSKEYPTWRSYFDLVVVGAGKPGFFSGREPLAELDEEGHIVRRPATDFEPGRIYQGGNLRDLEQGLGFAGEDIMYVGDHIYGDILRSKKTSLWRTALVVEEVEDEIRLTGQNRDLVHRMWQLESERRNLDDLTNLQRLHLSAMEKEKGSKAARDCPEHTSLRKSRDQNKRALKRVLKEMEALEQTLDEAFNPNWGMVFKEERENSRFGDQVTEYACIYTSRVSNFLYYSAYQYFRSPRDIMSHERHTMSWSPVGDVPVPTA